MFGAKIDLGQVRFMLVRLVTGHWLWLRFKSHAHGQLQHTVHEYSRPLDDDAGDWTPVVRRMNERGGGELCYFCLVRWREPPGA